jgi:hypothetical protein
VTSFSRQKCNNAKNKKHTIFKNDMFYVHGKFSRIRMKIKEVEAYWRFLHAFLTGVDIREYRWANVGQPWQ